MTKIEKDKIQKTIINNNKDETKTKELMTKEEIKGRLEYLRI